MKKIIILSIMILILTGCSKKENIQIDNNEPIEIIEKEEYKDENNTLIGLYIEKGNKLELITDYKTNIKSGVDIGIFQIYPSNDNQILLNNGFGNSFYNAWSSLPNYENLKIGFNVKYKLNSGEEISYNILDYNVIYKEIYNYLYDDYANRNKSWYSHIVGNDYSDDTLFTSIKLYGASVESINSKIILTVFTYDDTDDFDENNEYRGNSSYSIEICDINKTCD